MGIAHTAPTIFGLKVALSIYLKMLFKVCKCRCSNAVYLWVMSMSKRGRWIDLQRSAV